MVSANLISLAIILGIISLVILATQYFGEMTVEINETNETNGGFNETNDEIIGEELNKFATFTIETLSSSCSGAEVTEMEITAQGNSIIVIESIQTANPCYAVEGNATINDYQISVDLSAVSKGGTCIQCIGEVTGKVVIQNLTKGTYGVKVNTPDRAAITTIMIE